MQRKRALLCLIALLFHITTTILITHFHSAAELPPDPPAIASDSNNNCCAAVAEQATANAYCMSEPIKNIGPVSLLIVSTLLLMGGAVAVVACVRWLKFAVSGRRARRAAAQMLKPLRAGDLAAAAELSVRHADSTLAQMLRAGLRLTQADDKGLVAFVFDRERFCTGAIASALS